MELNQKIACIGDVVVSGKEKGHENATKPVEVHSLPSNIVSSVSAAESKRLKKSHKRSAPYPMYDSDWKTDTDDGDTSPNYHPKQKKQVRICKLFINYNIH